MGAATRQYRPLAQTDQFGARRLTVKISLGIASRSAARSDGSSAPAASARTRRGFRCTMLARARPSGPAPISRENVGRLHAAHRAPESGGGDTLSPADVAVVAVEQALRLRRHLPPGATA